MRLAAYTDADGFGGAELCLGHLLGALDGAIEPTVIATHGEVGAAIAAHRPGTRVLAVPRLDLRAHLGALRVARPDVLHSNHSWPWACATGEVAGLLHPGTKVLVVDHLPHDSAVPRRTRLARQAIARGLTAHVAVGERAARQVEDVVGVPRGSVTGIPNGVPPMDVAPVARPVAGPLVGSLGRLTGQKGYDTLVRALPDLPGVTAVLVGDGPERAGLERLAAELGVAERLRITGWTAEARRWLPVLDVFVLPSRWEGLPLVILEAMHAARPVVATPVGSVPEAVAHERTGLLVAVDDPRALAAVLRRLLGDEVLRHRLGARAREVAARKFTAAAMARRYEHVYAAMLGVREALSA